MQLFSGLVRLDADLELVPDIARDWQVSKDGRTYTFRLRRGVKFHDGREVKAEDFVYSWQRACWPETGSQTAATYLGDIVGVGDVLAGEVREISGIRAVDDYTLEVAIDAPRSYFLYKLAYPTAFVVDKANVEAGGEWWRHPNGTGPFKLGDWVEDEKLELEWDPLYYGDVARLDSVVFHFLAGYPLNMYETDDIDVAGVSVSYIDRVTDEAGPFYSQLMIVPELSLGYLGFNTAAPPFDDVNVRRAFTQAVDKEKLATLVYRDMVQAAYGILPPGLPGHDEGLSGLEFNVEKARESIRASRYGDVSALPPITLTTSGWGGLIPGDLEAIISEWRQNLGVEVKVRQLEPQRYLYHLEEEMDDMYYLGWVADYPHPQNFLEVLFHSQAQYNYGQYRNTKVDALLYEAGTEQDNLRSLELYQQVERILVEDAACLPLWFGENYVLVKSRVWGYSLNPMGFASLNMVSVESK
ncbi:MAG TPA: peptide ABC transporter substrate-binding protein [Dehalococcoidales bacterium]|nr:peptide ABC transporter substrate-binding protein [Dehalococcoidales bacterium]